MLAACSDGCLPGVCLLPCAHHVAHPASWLQVEQDAVDLEGGDSPGFAAAEALKALLMKKGIITPEVRGWVGACWWVRVLGRAGSVGLGIAPVNGGMLPGGKPCRHARACAEPILSGSMLPAAYRRCTHDSRMQSPATNTLTHLLLCCCYAKLKLCAFELGKNCDKARVVTCLSAFVVCAQELRREMELMDARGMKQEGPRLVVRCWTDPGFKARLLQVRGQAYGSATARVKRADAYLAGTSVFSGSLN